MISLTLKTQSVNHYSHYNDFDVNTKHDDKTNNLQLILTTKNHNITVLNFRRP